MPALKELEVGVMFWAGRDPVETLREVKALGVRCGQLGVPGNAAIDGASAAAWKSALNAEQFSLVTVFAAYDGEDYADAPTVQRTVGFIPPGLKHTAGSAGGHGATRVIEIYAPAGADFHVVDE